MNSRRSGPGITRRQVTAAIGAAVPLSAQIATPKPSDIAPADKLSKAASDVREISERLAQMEVPMNVEPAFLFRP